MTRRRKIAIAVTIAVLLVWTTVLWATTFKYLYTSEVTYASTNAYGGATGDLANDQAWDVGADIDLETNGYYGLWISIEYDSAGTTDNIILGYFGSYDGTNFDDLPIWEVTLDDNGGADAEDPAAIVSATDPGAVWVAGDYRLRADSPCVDAGDPNYAGDPNAVDLDGKTRLAGRAVDMGAYELQSLVPVYCFVSSVTSRYFYTVEESERDALLQMPQLWTSKGIAYRAFASAIEPTLKPVYRFWSDKLSSHFWTISEAEKDALIERYASVWAYEGPVFYAYPEGSQPADAKPVYRFWSGISEAHYYTISETEKNLLMTQGDVWAFEGIAWYAYEPQSTGGQEPPSAYTHIMIIAGTPALIVLTALAMAWQKRPPA
jgi:hypothetical protein